MVANKGTGGKWANADSEAYNAQMAAHFTRLREQSQEAVTHLRAQQAPAPGAAQNAAPAPRVLPQMALTSPLTENQSINHPSAHVLLTVEADRASSCRDRAPSREGLPASSQETASVPLLRFSQQRQEFLNQTRPIEPPFWAPPSEVPTEAHGLLAKMDEGDAFWYGIRRHCPDDTVALWWVEGLFHLSSCAGGFRRGQRLTDSSLRVATSVGTVAESSSTSGQVGLPSSSTSENVIRKVVGDEIPSSSTSANVFREAHPFSSRGWNPPPANPSPLERADPSAWPAVVASKSQGARNRSHSLPFSMLLSQGNAPVENAAPLDEDTASWEGYCRMYPALLSSDDYEVNVMGRRWYPQDETPTKKKEISFHSI